MHLFVCIYISLKYERKTPRFYSETRAKNKMQFGTVTDIYVQYAWYFFF